MPEIDKKSMIATVETLITFEEEMAAYYTAVASLAPNISEFWESASLLKQTRANLYANLLKDIESQWLKYQFNRGVTGSFINLMNKVRTQTHRLTVEMVTPGIHGRFIQEVENAVLNASMVPDFKGDTDIYGQVEYLLNKTQLRQLRLINGYIRNAAVASAEVH